MDEPAAILIVEDRGIVAAKVKRDLEAAGFAVAGMAATIAMAVRLAETLPIRGAVLDVDLRGMPAYPVAAVLRTRGIPFLFLTGFGRTVLPPEWATVPLLEKPFEREALVRALRLALAGSQGEVPPPRTATAAIRRAWGEIRHMRDLVTEQRAWTEQAGIRQDRSRG